MIRFGPYRLDPSQGLTRGNREVRLTPRSLAVLAVLVGHPGRIVSKDELFSTVWHDTAVTDAALATCVQEIRRALGDSSRDARFVETVHRRGYRFVAPTSDATAGSKERPQMPSVANLVGRERELDLLADIYDRARRGVRQVCLISGEPGIGKSAILAEALARIQTRGHVSVTWANCVEQYGSGEPYQPLLDALMRLSRGPDGDQTVAILERYAPMWLAQLPGILTPHDAAALQQRLMGAAPDRMLRELTNAIDTLASHEPLVLAIEDLHWSDPSTIDWISTVTARMDPAQLLVIATLRPFSSAEVDGPLALLYESVRARRLAREVVLGGLPIEAVTDYILQRVPPAQGRRAALERLAERVHRHTGGNPLFMATVLDQLIERRIVTEGADGWDTSDTEEAALEIPDSIRPVIERQIGRLSPDELQVLEAASVCGETFDLQVVAGAAELDEDAAETVLRKPGSRRFVRPSVTEPADDRGPPRLQFVHALFRNALYGAIPRSRRAELHRRIADLHETASGARADAFAAELALHFELGGNDSRAIHYLQRAGDSARRRSAFREARRHYERALDLLARPPADASTAARELPLQIGLGAATMATAGFGAPEVEAAYSRARELSRQIGDTPEQFPALFGLWLFYWGRGEVKTADALARDLRRRAGGDRDRKLQAAHASWTTSFTQGDFGATRRYARTGATLYEPERHAAMAATYGGHNPQVCGGMFAGRAAAIMGDVDDSYRLGDEAVDLARSLEHPFSLGLALTFRAASAQALADYELASVHADEAISIAREQGFRLMLGWGLAVSGWVAVRRGDAETGGSWIDEAIRTTRATGSDQFLSYLNASRAEAYLSAGQPLEALQAVHDGFAAVERTAERFCEAELHRLQGEALLAAHEDVAGASRAFRKAVDVATLQGANLFGLRSAVRLATLDMDRNGTRELLQLARARLPAATGLAEASAADALLASSPEHS